MWHLVFFVIRKYEIQYKFVVDLMFSSHKKVHIVLLCMLSLTQFYFGDTFIKFVDVIHL